MFVHKFFVSTGKSVCRSLFSRSLSVSCEVGTKRKRGREEEEEEEGSVTHPSKRRLTLQRHHTMVDDSSSRAGSLKSPRKSFYSGMYVCNSVEIQLVVAMGAIKYAQSAFYTQLMLINPLHVQ